MGAGIQAVQSKLYAAMLPVIQQLVEFRVRVAAEKAEKGC